MTFIDAIKCCFTKYADFEGCASRSEYWWWQLFTVLAIILLMGSLLSVALVGLVVPGVAVTTRRLHDIDRSGWFQLLLIIPFIGSIVILLMCVRPSKQSRYSKASLVV